MAWQRKRVSSLRSVVSLAAPQVCSGCGADPVCMESLTSRYTEKRHMKCHIPKEGLFLRRWDPTQVWRSI